VLKFLLKELITYEKYKWYKQIQNFDLSLRNGKNRKNKNTLSQPNSEFTKEFLMSTIHLQLPLTDETVRSLRAGDLVTLSGEIYTGRDAAHTA
jgi:hypothetical protein